MTIGHIKILGRSFLRQGQDASINLVNVNIRKGENGYLLQNCDFLGYEDNKKPFIYEGDNAGKLVFNFPSVLIDSIIIVNYYNSGFEDRGLRNNGSNIQLKNLLINGERVGNIHINSVNNNNEVKNTVYISFDPVMLDEVQIVPFLDIKNNYKINIGQILFCKEIGTFAGYPEIGQLSFNNNSRSYKSKAGGTFITKQNLTLDSLSLNFKNYNNVEDIELIHKLHEYQNSFYLWLCGGDESQFRFLQEGFRLQDIYHVQTNKSLKIRYKSGMYKSVIDAKISFVEAV